MLKSYKEIRKELARYDKNLSAGRRIGESSLSEKEEIIILTKSDVISDLKIIAKAVKAFEKLGKKVFTLSLFDDKMVKKFRDELVKILKKQ